MARVLTDDQWEAVLDYVNLLESSQDGYYRASESDEANKWRNVAAPVGEPAAMPPEIQVGDVVVWDMHNDTSDNATWCGTAARAKAWNKHIGGVVAIYRDPLWRRTDRKEPTS